MNNGLDYSWYSTAAEGTLTTPHSCRFSMILCPLMSSPTAEMKKGGVPS